MIIILEFEIIREAESLFTDNRDVLHKILSDSVEELMQRNDDGDASNELLKDLQQLRIDGEPIEGNSQLPKIDLTLSAETYVYELLFIVCPLSRSVVFMDLNQINISVG